MRSSRCPGPLWPGRQQVGVLLASIGLRHVDLLAMAWPIHVAALELRSLRLSQCHDKVRPWATNTAVRWDWIVGGSVTCVHSVTSPPLPSDLAWLQFHGGQSSDFCIMPLHIDHQNKILKMRSMAYTQPRRCLWMFAHETPPCVTLTPGTCSSLAENNLLQVTLWADMVPTRVHCNGAVGGACLWRLRQCPLL